jgi:hypothetical protein
LGKIWLNYIHPQPCPAFKTEIHKNFGPTALNNGQLSPKHLGWLIPIRITLFKYISNPGYVEMLNTTQETYLKII